MEQLSDLQKSYQSWRQRTGRSPAIPDTVRKTQEAACSNRIIANRPFSKVGANACPPLLDYVLGATIGQERDVSVRRELGSSHELHVQAMGTANVARWTFGKGISHPLCTSTEMAAHTRKPGSCVSNETLTVAYSVVLVSTPLNTPTHTHTQARTHAHPSIQTHIHLLEAWAGIVKVRFSHVNRNLCIGRGEYE